ncbi:Cytochrome P450 716B1 like [Actinidia chinensis var. chinensis]|uniref:Cytochrome P450 716B1 like n=1 Tax=Actinidia chinensis var. chinensis TaxID=1590841 RepID=A0A2R6PTA9_ACTCC|nr:Cytochrome P450 716B1 like [Actinidia chinensis var. chinensis]
MNPFLSLCLFIVPIFFLLLKRGSKPSKRLPLPPGSLGIPIVGQSLIFLRQLKANTADKWFEERAKKYGPISKLSLFGKPTVFIHGQAANKFVFTSDSSTISNQQVASVRAILGERNITELSGEDHKRVRDALVSFLKPECLKQYIEKMDAEVRRHIDMHWEGHQKVTVRQMSPIYNRGLQATTRIRNIVIDLMREKRVELEQKGASISHQDLITCLLSIGQKNNKEGMFEDEIVHNVVTIMIAGHDTSSVLLTFIIRLLANDPTICASVVQEQEKIAKSKASGEWLTWEDLAKMKYTWKVALETLRIVPPVFGGFRKAMKDIEYGGYLIPKRWQIFWVKSMTHMDGDIFQDPSKYDPMRFENQASIPPYCFIPFGAGPRICPGYEFARIETLVTIHYLVTRFTWKLYCTDNGFSRDPTAIPAQGLPIQIVPKKILQK